MELFFSPMACSLASRIALYEAGTDARFTEVDTRSKTLRDGGDYWAVTPMGQVPALRTDEGVLLTENAAVLQYVAEAYPAAQLLPADAIGRARLRQWLGFIGTELHKTVFVPLLDKQADAAVHDYARARLARRMGVLQQHLATHEHLLDGGYSVADAYLTAVLNWAPYAGVDLAEWPAVQQYQRRMAQRPAAARAIAEEFTLYQEELARRRAA